MNEGASGSRSRAITLEEKKTAAIVGAFGFMIAMTAFTFIGGSILAVFGISLPAFRLAGGFLLLLIALSIVGSDRIMSSAAERRWPSVSCR